MGAQFEEYYNSIDSEGTRKALRKYGAIAEYDDSDKSRVEVERIFRRTDFPTLQDLRSFRTQFRKYAIYLGDEGLVDSLDSLDLRQLFHELRRDKYISYETLRQAIERLDGNLDDINRHYESTLLLAIYEGIYSKQFDVIANLRKGDIRGGQVIITPDDEEPYSIDISGELSARLEESSGIFYRAASNRYSQRLIPLEGEAPDSCFKVEAHERAKHTLETYQNVIRRILREDVSKAVGYDVTAHDIFISGVMHRLSILLMENGYSFSDTLTKGRKRSRAETRLIEECLSKYRAKIETRNLTQIICGYEDLFDLPPDFTIRPSERRIKDEMIEDILAYEARDWSKDVEEVGFRPEAPTPKRELIAVSGRFVYPRDKRVANAALRRAHYTCEINSDHPSFISSSTNRPYMEPHHLVPLAFSDRFSVNLDTEANVVSLCSNCHNEIHYGKERARLIKKLFDLRKDRLAEMGIELSIDELVTMYS